MAVSIPDGYVTRPAASKVYNRSKRALERDLEDAYVAGDDDVLAAFQLVTNDRVKREAPTVTTELVAQLKKDGKNPMWCVSEDWLESKYGRKGEPKPEPKEAADRRIERDTRSSKSDKNPIEASDDRGGGDKDEPSGIDRVYLPNDVEFLKERIRTLEREKSKEIDRNEKREAKLFQQLEVKDRQISAWDEVTQGITRGLATGAIQPKLVSGMAPKDESGQESESPPAPHAAQAPEVIDATPAAPSKTAEGQKKQAPPKRKPRAPERRKAVKTKAGTTTKGKPPAKNKAATKKAPSKKAKKQGWLNTPISDLLFRR